MLDCNKTDLPSTLPGLQKHTPSPTFFWVLLHFILWKVLFLTKPTSRIFGAAAGDRPRAPLLSRFSFSPSNLSPTGVSDCLDHNYKTSAPDHPST